MLFLTSCAQGFNSDNNSTQWDFDHNVRFIKTDLTENTFQLELIPNIRGNFEQLSAFLIRESYKICGRYQYKIEIIQGVEGFDDKKAMPNYIPSSLIANIECKYHY